MIRFALIPFAFLASACADSADLAQATDDLEQDFKELVEDHQTETDRSANERRPNVLVKPKPQAVATIEKPREVTLGEKVVTVATHRFARGIEKAGCKMVGAAFGAWKDQRLDYKGQMFHTSGKSMERIQGELVVTSNGGGELSGFGISPDSGIATVAIEGDWTGGQLDADVAVRKGDRIHELVLIGDIDGAFDARGHFIGALALCK